MNSSDSARFERAYATIWMALHRGDEPDLSQHERQLLHHVPAGGGVELKHIAWHLALPKSTASALVKGLERVAADSVLDVRGLQAALADLSSEERRALLEAIEKLADSARTRPQEPR